jgi:hypothetical protein
MQESM